jgi:5'-nucleotidase
MKKLRRLLLTGDDGYDSPGTRILARMLRDKYDCVIIGTVGQQSGVGGHMSLKNGGKYGESLVEGVRAVWINGYPCDGVEFAVGYFREPFDLIVSGINWGMNIGGAIISSGTYAAANRALSLKLAPQAVVMSWHVPAKYWTFRHEGNHDISEYLAYPGRQAAAIIDLAVENGNWEADLINVNFPTEKTDAVRFTRGLDDLRRFFNYPLDRDPESGTFSYPKKDLRTDTVKELDVDTGALLSGFITISPHRASFLDERVYGLLKDREIILKAKL